MLGYNEKVVRQQILKARKFPRKDLLNQGSKTKGGRGEKGNKLIFSFTYHPAYSNLNIFLSNINLLLIPDSQHRKFFVKCLLLVIKGGKALKICWLGQKFRWKKKQMGNLEVVRENVAKFSLF